MYAGASVRGAGAHLAIVDGHCDGLWGIGEVRRRGLMLFPQACEMIALRSQLIPYPLGEGLDVPSREGLFQDFTERAFGLFEGAAASSSQDRSQRTAVRGIKIADSSCS